MMRWGAMLILTAIAMAAADRKPAPWEKSNLRIGQALYRENCVVCHDIDVEKSKKIGPNFYQLFKREQMPILKAQPSREYIKVRAKFGGPLMPAFKDTLTDAQIDLLIDYVASK